MAMAIGSRNNQYRLGGDLLVAIEVDLFEWLILTSKGQGLNFSTSVLANTIQQFNINPPAGYDYILYHAIQWTESLQGQLHLNCVVEPIQ